MKGNESDSDILAKARRAVARSGLTLQQLGVRMGYPPESARQTVSRFLHSRNPTVAMLRKLAKALGVELGDLL
jgi:transcriptional regulator with XRE-family HTH domain